MSQMNAPLPQPSGAGRPQNGLGTAGLVLGIIGVIPCFWGVLSILAIIFGAIGLNKVNKGLATNKGAALTGLVLGVVGIILFIIFLALGVVSSLMSSVTGGS